MKKFIFIGGLKRGYAVLEEFLSQNLIPDRAFVFREDAHEIEKYSLKFQNLLENKCPVKICKQLSSEDYQSMDHEKYDFAIVCGWRTIIDYKRIYPILRKGMFAAHDSILPKYRGFAPTNWAIINGEKHAGVSIFKIDEGEVDSGEIYFQSKVVIENSDDINDVMKKITTETVKGYKYLVENLNEISPVIQNEDEASYCCARSPEDGKINWSNHSFEVYNLCRALVHPYPGAFFMLEDKKLLVNKISICSTKNYVGSIPGKVVGITAVGIEVLCGTGSVRIEEVVVDGKIYSPKDIIKSIRITLL